MAGSTTTSGRLHLHFPIQPLFSQKYNQFGFKGAKRNHVHAVQLPKFRLTVTTKSMQRKASPQLKENKAQEYLLTLTLTLKEVHLHSIEVAAKIIVQRRVMDSQKLSGSTRRPA